MHDVNVLGPVEIEALGRWALFTWNPGNTGLPAPRLVIPIRALPQMVSHAAIFMIEQGTNPAIEPMLWH